MDIFGIPFALTLSGSSNNGPPKKQMRLPLLSVSNNPIPEGKLYVYAMGQIRNPKVQNPKQPVTR